MQQTDLVAPDRFKAPTNVPELLLMKVLKLHLATMPVDQTGWLHALRDAVLAPALAAIHASPERKWNLLTLAREASVSVSLLDERSPGCTGRRPDPLPHRMANAHSQGSPSLVRSRRGDSGPSRRV